MDLEHKKRRLIHRLHAVILVPYAAFFVFWVLCVGPLAWILRDGLGPKAVASSGSHAIARFLITWNWGAVVVSVTCLAAALYLVIFWREGIREA